MKNMNLYKGKEDVGDGNLTNTFKYNNYNTGIHL